MSNDLSVGMVLAFIAYKGQLTNRFANLIEQVIQFKMMRLHLDRISNIALTLLEQYREGEATFNLNDEGKSSGEITLQDVCFSYDEGESAILTNINLSGGQIQRLLLARALYQSPCVLFMDKATSHLDSKNEAKISEQIQHLSMTRIMIAHRKETIEKAEKILELVNGKLTR